MTNFVTPVLRLLRGGTRAVRATLLLFALSCFAVQAQPLPDLVGSMTRGGTEPERQWSKQRPAAESPPARSISLPAVASERLAVESGQAARIGTPLKIGFPREVAALADTGQTSALLQWQDLPLGGRIAALRIVSPPALGIRIGVRVHRLPAAATLRFYSVQADAALEVGGGEVLAAIARNVDAGDNSEAAHTYWSPHFDGDAMTLEIELPPGIGPDMLELAVPRISHLFVSPLDRAGLEKVGQSASCEIDATCYSDWSDISKAVARMIYVEAGSSYTCSGTLLNDRASSGTPYFLSANHCISDQTTASTLQTYWFYRSTACNSGVLNSAYKTTTGGATLLYNNLDTDTSFMRLNNSPPSGVVHAGWTSDPVAIGTQTTGVHHPSGDMQKINFGSVQAYFDCTSSAGSGSFTCGSTSQGSADHLEVTYSSGVTESGSSGSGLFITGGGSHYLVGQLHGGTNSCTRPADPDFYGRFDLAYSAALKQWLDADRQPVYRFFNNNAGGHFFTISEAEKNTVINNYSWFRYEGVGFYASTTAQTGLLPVYRFFNNNAGGHFFTISETEKNTVINNYNWFRYEGVGFYASPTAQASMLPVYRFFNNNAGGHFFTISEAEKNTVINNYNWFRYEGVGFYAYP